MSKNRVNKNQTTDDEVRPIGARALKSAIDSLRPYLFEAELLDLFAGQGRFGITASAEGISSVTFVEKSRTTASLLSKQIQAPSFPKTVQARVVCQDTLSFLKYTTQKFDIVFYDPPFPIWNSEFQEKLFSAVSKVLKADSIFLVKHPSRVLLFPLTDAWKLTKQTEFGESELLYFNYEENP
jgi:16S rRNA (guanine(966)-N(2))-methyltransferase RsmD